MQRQYLKQGDKVLAKDVILEFLDEKNGFIVSKFNGELLFKGKTVEFDDNSFQPYVNNCQNEVTCEDESSYNVRVK